MIVLDFWSALSLVGIGQAILLLVLFGLDKRKYFSPNLYLIALLLWIVWVQLEFLVIRKSFVINVNVFFGSRHGVWLLLGPLVYHYVLRSFRPAFKFRLLDVWHYLPFILFALILPLTGSITISGRVIDYGMLSVLKFPVLAKSWLDTAYGYIFVGQFIHASVYLILSLRVINTAQKQSMADSSDNRLVMLRYLKALVITMILAMFAAVLFIGVLLNSRWYVRELDYIYLLPLTLCIYFFSYYAMRLPSLFEHIHVPISKTAPSASEKEGQKQLFEKIKLLISTRKLYQNPELRLSDLSAESGISYHQLSEIINREANVSFFEFINQFRINEVLETLKSKALENKKINVLEIAYASGFNNKVSFNRYFKKQTGKTPTEFIKNNLK
jgi:AraC-like DNA-binding protein